MPKNGMPEGIKTAMFWSLGVGIVALILIIMLVIFGNLSGNLGFATTSLGYNNTQAVINNYSTSATNLAAQFPTVGTIIGIALLLVVLIGLLAFAIRKMMGVAENPTGGGSNDSFA